MMDFLSKILIGKVSKKSGKFVFILSFNTAHQGCAHAAELCLHMQTAFIVEVD